MREITSRLEVIKKFEAYDFLFRDLQHLVSLEEDTLLLVATVRVEGYEQKEKANRVAMAAKLEAEAASAEARKAGEVQVLESEKAPLATPLVSAAMTILPRELITIMYKDMKSGPKLLEVIDAEGNDLPIKLTGDGQIKTITIEV